MNPKAIESEIFSKFAEIACRMGYSDVHGRIIGVMLVARRPMTLNELVQRTDCSSATISLSLDFLELVGMVKKIKKAGDRKLYVEMRSNIIDGLKNALLIKIQKSVDNTLAEFSNYRAELNAAKNETSAGVIRTLDVIEGEIKKVSSYVNMLSKVKLPDDS